MDQTSNPCVGPVADLVDVYAGSGVDYLENHERAAAVARLVAWLDSHPGRWAMFNDGTDGVSLAAVQNRTGDGYTTRERKSKKDGRTRFFARKDAEGAEHLELALLREGSPQDAADDLPWLTASEFNWSPEELETACKVARDNLFPVPDGIRRRRKR